MKTENLSWAEAIKVYANGERICNRYGTEYWIDGELPRSLRKTGDADYETPFYFGDEPFSIVKPEPKRLTLAEAYEEWAHHKRVKIDTSELDPGSSITLGYGMTPSEVIAVLGVAELKGWAVTVPDAP